MKVGHVGLFRYSRIFQRNDGSMIPIPVACVGDRDIPPKEAKGLGGAERPKKTEDDFSPEEIAKKELRLRRDEGAPVRVFIAEHWTLEYDLAVSGMAVELHQATALANANPDEERQAILAGKRAEVEAWQASGLSNAEIACRVYEPMYRGSVSKAQVAEQLASLLDAATEDIKPRLPGYLIDAIEYATTPFQPSPVAPTLVVNAEE